MMIKMNAQICIKKIIIVLCIGAIIKISAREPDAFEHVWEGNLALPTSQQPGALFALGQNIIDKNDFLVLADYDYTKGRHRKHETITPLLLYGINDVSSLFIMLPIEIDLKDNNHHSSGIGDITVQYEYAYYFKSKLTNVFMATVLANIGLPTGSFKKNPSTGFGSTSFFLGATFSYLATDWYAYISAGATLTTSHHCDKAGNQFLYQWGFGKNIAYRPKKWIFTWVVEFNGTYEQRDKINRVIDKNSGGNTLLGGFTLWFSTEKLILISDISVPIAQHLFGKQNKKHSVFELIMGWKFN